MKGSKSGAACNASGSKVVVEVGKRSHFRTRVGMDFDPRNTKLHSEEDVDEYLVRYGVGLSPGIKVEFCPQDTEFVKSSPNDGVYMLPQILELGLKLPLTKFVRSILTYYRIAPSKLSGVAWRTVLGSRPFAP